MILSLLDNQQADTLTKCYKHVFYCAIPLYKTTYPEVGTRLTRAGTNSNQGYQQNHAIKMSLTSQTSKKRTRLFTTNFSTNLRTV